MALVQTFENNQAQLTDVLDLRGLNVNSPGNGSFTVAPGGGNIGLELRNTAGGLTYFDFTSDAVRDFDLRVLVNTDGTEARFIGRAELSLFFDLPAQFNGFVTLANSMTLLNAGGSKSFTFQGTAATQENIDFVTDAGLQWRLLRAPGNSALILQRYISSVFQDNAVAFDNATGLLTLAKGVQNVDPIYLRSNTVAGADAIQTWETSGVRRWALGKAGTPETGSNTGSDFGIFSYADNGTLLDTPVTLNRATGELGTRDLRLGGIITRYNGGTIGEGELMIGSPAFGGFSKNTLTPGPGIAIDNGPGSITISSVRSYEVKTAGYTLAASDNGKLLHFTNTNPVILTIPAESSVPLGFEVLIIPDRVVTIDATATAGITAACSLPTHTLLRGFEYCLRRTTGGWVLSISSALPGLARTFEAEFLTATLPDWLISSNAGTGSAITAVGNGVSINSSRPGAIQMNPGTTATGHRSIGTTATGLNLGAGLGILVSSVMLCDVAPDAANDYQIRVGIQNSLNSPTAAGAFFRCTFGQNGGLYQAVSRTATTETVINSVKTATAIGVFDMLLIPGVAVRYWIDGVFLGEITTNVPTVGSTTGLVAGIFKTTGTTARSLFLNKLQLVLGT